MSESFRFKSTNYGPKGYSFKDITGQKFSKLTAIKYHSGGKSGTKWVFKCKKES